MFIVSRHGHTLLHISAPRCPARSASEIQSTATSAHAGRRPLRPAPAAPPPSTPAHAERRPRRPVIRPVVGTATSSFSSPAERRPRHPVNRPVVGAPAPSVSSLLQHKSLNILPTALVVLDMGSRDFETGALIDPCTPVSSIDDSLASAFKLPTTRVGNEKVCTAVIRTKTGDFRLEAILKVEPRLRPLSDTIRARFDDLKLADAQFHRPATISLVLGADVYPKVTTRVPGTRGRPSCGHEHGVRMDRIRCMHAAIDTDWALHPAGEGGGEGCSG
ncbi:uncharacterized protein [Drosophila pseudoobscura]|uniref:Uncharacterized protein isoform X3 n=1 Tax=Drosophila pseudoobscura pseudoobscura TaxID=46245 RepID=A0A6I8W437_DROPS|nr:uncharacterized protein LOC26534064 isoform X3 [Drosophila pseudoobscura]